MTYEQSIKNVEIVKNFASPLEDYFLYFRYINDTEFEVQFITINYESREFEDYEDIKRQGYRAELPFATIGLDEKFSLILQYDDTVLHYRYDLTQKSLFDHTLKESTRNSKGLKENFLELIKLLKNE